MASLHEHVLPAAGELGVTAERKLLALCTALRWPEPERARQTLRRLARSFYDEPLSFGPPWPTDLTDDGTPFEFSVALGEDVELRMLVEAQQKPFDLASNWRAGRELNRALASQPGVSFRAFDHIAAAFAPAAGDRGTFAIWHAANLDARGGDPSFKVYLNPQIHGEQGARELVKRALVELDMESCWHELQARIPSDEEPWLFLSLDLSEHASARVKIYTAHPGCSSDRLEQLFRGTPHYRPGDAARWSSVILGDSPVTDAKVRPVLSCIAFSASRAPQTTLHMPVRCFAAHDEDALQRTLTLLDSRRAARLQACIRRWAGRPLTSGRGLLTYVSCRPEATGTRLTTYLAPQLYSISAARTTSAGSPTHADSAVGASEIRELVAPGASSLTMRLVRESIEHHRQALSLHPFIRRLDATGSLEAVRAMAPQLTFFVLAFQDMLRLARAHADGGPFAELARTHEAEDRGHEQWFLNDLEVLQATRDLRWVFSSAHTRTRDVGYALVAEVLHARDDRARLSVLLALEAAGAEFFGRAIAHLERIGRAERLQYFARQHQQIEQNHNVFEDEEQAKLWSLPLPAELRADVLAAVERTFAQMTRLASYLEETMHEVDRSTATS